MMHASAATNQVGYSRSLLSIIKCLAFAAKHLLTLNSAFLNQAYFRLRNGMYVPLVGFGMAGHTRAAVRPALRAALKAGYRLFDGAHVYSNEDDVGAVLRCSLCDAAAGLAGRRGSSLSGSILAATIDVDIETDRLLRFVDHGRDGNGDVNGADKRRRRRRRVLRGDIVYTSKVWVYDLDFKSTLRAVEETLERVKTHYIDIYLYVVQRSGDAISTCRAWCVHKSHDRSTM
jgi:aryl-alcohol dehydrogenase-like predicted oxidoreductase